MHFSHAKRLRAGFTNPPELLIVVAIFAIISAIILPAAFKHHWNVWATVGIIVGAFALFVLWIQHRNIIDWFRGRKWRKRDHDA